MYDICIFCLRIKNQDGSNETDSILSCGLCGIWWHENCLCNETNPYVKVNTLFCYNCKSCSSNSCLRKHSKEAFLLKCYTCTKCFHFDCAKRRKSVLSSVKRTTQLTSTEKPWQCSTCFKKKTTIFDPTKSGTPLSETTKLKKRKLDQISLFTNENARHFKKIKQKGFLKLTNLIGFPQVSTIKFYDNDISLFSTPNSETYPEVIICEYCLCVKKKTKETHYCGLKHPPGNEIYCRGTLSVFEVDGNINPSYCRRLCLFAKYFIQEKTVYWDVDAFYFYILFDKDAQSLNHFRGFFSKEKGHGPYNLGAIVVLPPFQRRGFGTLLIDLSYSLSRMEGHIKTPERPFSKLGKQTYLGYWTSALFRYFLLHLSTNSFTLNDISRETGMTPDDIVMAFEYLKIIQFTRSGEWKDPVLVLQWQVIKVIVKKFEKLRICEEHLCLFR